MDWLLNLDLALFRFLNGYLANPALDTIMPWFSDNSLFVPALVLICAFALFRGGSRAAVCISLLLLVIVLGDGLIVRELKQALNRPRPAAALESLNLLVGPGGSGSMPSAHAANWFSAVLVCFIYYRRSLWLTLPLACLVSFSRVYNGAHYPSDVIAGAAIGAGYAAAIAWSLRQLWAWAGPNFFPLWWEAMPDLFNPPGRCQPLSQEEEDLPLRPPPGFRAPSKASTLLPAHVSADRQWLYLGYIIIALILSFRLFYIARPAIELSEDEAYQWVWSKHLALSYYSKPPLIAYTQFLGTNLWGDTELGVRFFSPFISAILGIALLRFFAREVNARAGFFLLLISSATPLLSAGSVLMTIDPLSVVFWMAATLAGWKAIQDNAGVREWLWVGLWMGLGFLSKYVQLLQLVCWVLFFVLWPPARKHLRRPGPYLALAVNALATVPVLIWNYQHQWISARHVAGNAALDESWKPSPRYLLEFLGAEFGLLNPVFFIATAWAAFAFWRLGRRNPKLLYFFSMGAPVFIIYTLYTLHSRVLPNWIAPSVLPLFCFMVIYWDTRWRLGSENLKPWLVTGLVVGFSAVVLCHETDVVKAFIGRPLPASIDPLRRVRGWQSTASAVGEAREDFLAEGKPVFIIGSHYGITGLISFYLPEAKAQIRSTPLVYSVSSPSARNQFHLWPGYETRKGENAIFVRDVNPGKKTRPLPATLHQEFESITSLGTREITRKGRPLRTLELYACRGLR